MRGIRPILGQFRRMICADARFGGADAFCSFVAALVAGVVRFASRQPQVVLPMDPACGWC